MGSPATSSRTWHHGKLAGRLPAAISSSLKLKLTLSIVALLALTLGIAPWGAIKVQERQLLEASRERLGALNETLRRAVATTCMLTGNMESVQKLLEALSSHNNIHLASHQDIAAVRLFDAHGVIRYSSHPAERGTRLSQAELSRYYGHADPIIVTGNDGGAIHTLVRPMFNQGECTGCHPSEQKILGILQVSLSIDRMEQQLSNLRRSALLATLVTMILIVASVWFALRQLVDQPLQKLAGVMTRVEHGDLGTRLETTSSDELGQLARHFNDMIAKLQAAQAELERYHQQQLARADRLATVGAMAAAMAHEIRNPLTGISGALSVLSREFPADDPRREIVRQTHQLIDRLNNSVEDILHYSRPSLPQLQTVRLDDIVDQTLSLIEGEARKARVAVVKQVAEGSGTTCPTVNADPHQLQQVLTNLALNAIQASRPGTQVCIRLHASSNDGTQKHVRIEVEDTGKGMNPEEAAKAFDPFFSTKAQGTGLGLSIAKQIVEQHHGRIVLQSTPGKGTCVVLELPADSAAPGEN